LTLSSHTTAASLLLAVYPSTRT